MRLEAVGLLDCGRAPNAQRMVAVAFLVGVGVAGAGGVGGLVAVGGVGERSHAAAAGRRLLGRRLDGSRGSPDS
jgi:hypothetical protein